MIGFFLLESFGQDILVRLLFEVPIEGILDQKGLPFQVVYRWHGRIFDVAAAELLIFRQKGLGMSDKVLE